MSKPDEPRNIPDSEEGSPDELLGDLESIKALLDEQAEPPSDTDRAAAGAADSTEPGVPLLDDMVDDAYQLKETSILSATPALGSGSRPNKKKTYLSEDLFDALLGDEWKSSASDILTEARGAIEAHRNQWTPDDTDQLNDALRVRIDETLSAWLRDTIRERMAELHAELLKAAEIAINEKIDALIEQRLSERPDTDA